MRARAHHLVNRLFIGLMGSRQNSAGVAKPISAPWEGVPFGALSLADRVRFWSELPARLAAVDARWPGRLTAESRAKVEASIERRIARPATASGQRHSFRP